VKLHFIFLSLLISASSLASNRVIILRCEPAWLGDEKGEWMDGLTPPGKIKVTFNVNGPMDVSRFVLKGSQSSEFVEQVATQVSKPFGSLFNTNDGVHIFIYRGDPCSKSMRISAVLSGFEAYASCATVISDEKTDDYDKNCQ
jgi:hypothetical protein